MITSAAAQAPASSIPASSRTLLRICSGSAQDEAPQNDATPRIAAQEVVAQGGHSQGYRSSGGAAQGRALQDSTQGVAAQEKLLKTSLVKEALMAVICTPSSVNLNAPLRADQYLTRRLVEGKETATNCEGPYCAQRQESKGYILSALLYGCCSSFQLKQCNSP